MNKISTWLYAGAAALFITAFTVDVHEVARKQAEVWRDADTTTELGSVGDVGSDANGSILPDKRSVG